MAVVTRSKIEHAYQVETKEVISQWLCRTLYFGVRLMTRGPVALIDFGPEGPSCNTASGIGY